MNVASPAPAAPAAPALPAMPAAGPAQASNGASTTEPFAQALQQARNNPPAEAAEAPASTQRSPQGERKEAARKPEARDRSRHETQPGTPGARVAAEPGRVEADATEALIEGDEPDATAADTGLPTDLPPWLQALAPAFRPQAPAAPRADVAPSQTEAAEPAAATRRPPRAAGPVAADVGAAGADRARQATEPAAMLARTGPAEGLELQPMRDEAPHADFRSVLRAAGSGEAGPLSQLAAQVPATAPEFHATDHTGATAAVPEREVRAPLHSPSFAPALGAQLTLLVKDGVTEARLHLNPAEMGPIAVQIHLDGSLARVEMVAEQAATRQVLEQSMPSLASALRDSGLTLAGGGVFDQASRQPQRGEAEGGRAGQGRHDADGTVDGADMLAAARPTGAPRGVVDLYA